MRQTRVVVLAAGMLMALAPMAANAQIAPTGQSANEAVIAQNNAAKQMGYIESQVLNHLAQCQIAASGGNVPGDVTNCPSTNNPYALVLGSAASGMSSSGGTSGTGGVNPGTAPGSCVAAQRPLTHAEQELVNAWAIAKDNAGGNLPEPPEVVALIGCI